MSTQESLRWDTHCDEQLEAHDNANHKDPQEYYRECKFCNDIIGEDIQNGIRCEHGNYVPYVKDKYGYYKTDIECIECGIDYGPAFEPFWIDTLGRAKI